MTESPAPHEIFPPPPPKPIVTLSLTCKSPAGEGIPAYSQTYAYPVPPNEWVYFTPWTVWGAPAAPTQFTVTGNVTAHIDGAPLPATVTVAVAGSGSANGGSGAQVPINLSASASGHGGAEATVVVNMENYGATPTNNYTVQAQTSAVISAVGQETLTVPLAIYVPVS